MSLYLLTFAAGLLFGVLLGLSAAWATYDPALRMARLRAESAELHVRVLSADRKAN